MQFEGKEGKEVAAPDAEQQFSLILEDRQQKMSEAGTRALTKYLILETHIQAIRCEK